MLNLKNDLNLGLAIYSWQAYVFNNIKVTAIFVISSNGFYPRPQQCWLTMVIKGPLYPNFEFFKVSDVFLHEVCFSARVLSNFQQFRWETVFKPIR